MYIPQVSLNHAVQGSCTSAPLAGGPLALEEGTLVRKNGDGQIDFIFFFNHSLLAWLAVFLESEIYLGNFLSTFDSEKAICFISFQHT